MYRQILGTGLLLMGLLACNLASETTSSIAPAVEPAQTDGWVAFPGDGVQIAAPPGEVWSRVPEDITEGREILTQWNNRDVTVGNVFLYLLPLATSQEYPLVLIKNDGTAWFHVARIPMPADVERGVLLEIVRNRLRAEGITVEPYRQMEVDLPAGKATGWELVYSPRNDSRALDHRLQYILYDRGQLYILTFNAQAPDYKAYLPVFLAMARSFYIVPPE